MSKKLKPGSLTPKSGQYIEKSHKGRIEREVTSTKGKPLPPTLRKGSTYELVDATKGKTNFKKSASSSKATQKRSRGDDIIVHTGAKK